MIRFATTFFFLILFLAACTSSTKMPDDKIQELEINPTPPIIEGDYTYPFHDVPVIDEYTNLTNPIPADEVSLARGKDAFLLYCAVCHGETGLGDGPGAAQLDPPVTAIANTQHILSDNFLYFRIRDGGAMAPFNSAMPAWENILEKRTIWDLINYIRTLEGDPNLINESE